MDKDYEQKIIKWWNDNAFCGCVVDNIKDIKSLLLKDHYHSVEHMIGYHIIQCSTIDNINSYLQDIVDAGLISGRAIDDYLRKNV